MFLVYIKSCVFTTLGWMISFILSVFVFLSFFPLRLTMRFMINNFWLLSIAFEKCHHLFEGAQHEIIVYYDHKNL